MNNYCLNIFRYNYSYQCLTISLQLFRVTHKLIKTNSKNTRKHNQINIKIRIQRVHYIRDISQHKKFLEGWPMYTLLSNKALKQIELPRGDERRSNKRWGPSHVTPDRVTRADCLYYGHGFFHLIVWFDLPESLLDLRLDCLNVAMFLLLRY